MATGAPEKFGPYDVYEELGVGGMASVHRAESHGVEGFTRLVALKRMLPHCAVSVDFVQSFVREARIASHLRHINVAQTYELGKVGDIYFIAMELVGGKNLRQVLRHCAQMTGPMPVAVTLNILNQICDALDYAHNLCDESGQPLGIIHRDVSPSNIIVSDEGVVKLIDFGIAKASAAGMQTMSGLLKGKFGYMAPEYIAGSIDARADLFAVGVIAHELFTNRPLFTSDDDMQTLQRVCGMAVKPPSARNPKVPPEIDEIVMTALARDPSYRWQHATALRAAMTTMTQRLQMVCSNSDVAEWLEWAFRQKRPVVVRMADEATTNITDRSADQQTAVETPDDLRKTLPMLGPPHSSPTIRPSPQMMMRPANGSGPDLAPPAIAAIPVLANPSPNPSVARVPRQSSSPVPNPASGAEPERTALPTLIGPTAPRTQSYTGRTGPVPALGQATSSRPIGSQPPSAFARPVTPMPNQSGAQQVLQAPAPAPVPVPVATRPAPRPARRGPARLILFILFVVAAAGAAAYYALVLA